MSFDDDHCVFWSRSVLSLFVQQDLKGERVKKEKEKEGGRYYYDMESWNIWRNRCFQQ